MIDPGAIGTLIIGRGPERRQPDGGYRPDGPLPRRPSRRVVRPALAILLRHVADTLEPSQRGRASGLDAERAASDTA
jgi:hypothetical protein